MTPHNYLGSAELKEIASEKLSRLGTFIDFYDKAKLKKRSAGAFLSVIQGTNSVGGILKSHWRPKRKRNLILEIYRTCIN